ncbi:MAG: hypothetical protein M3Z37_01220 [Candidatus Eremiobacteraeota bacterium]|nr:hypothetical protein [Candidatus Eremiobacteraeota bacterium]
MDRAKHTRAFTTVELLISMAIMGLVLALSVVEFAMVFNHNNLTNANLTAEQNARIAMAKVSNEFRQAMPNETTYNNSYPMVISPTPPPKQGTGSPVSTVQYWRVHNGPGGLASPIPTDNFGAPKPCYDTVTLTYDAVAKTVTRIATLQTDATLCPTASTTTDVIAYNVTNFSVTPVDTLGTLFLVDVQAQPSKGLHGTYDLSTQILMGWKP